MRVETGDGGSLIELSGRGERIAVGRHVRPELRPAGRRIACMRCASTRAAQRLTNRKLMTAMKMTTMKAHWGGLARLWLGACALLATRAALAVNDLPGGPARQPARPAPAGHRRSRADERWLHYFMLVICTVIFIGVFGVMFYSIFKHRKSHGHKAANFHESTTVEIVWTVVPFIIVIGMALPATKVVVAMKDTSPPT